VAKRRFRFDQAEALLLQSLELEPNRCEALADLGLVQAARDRIADGLRTLEVARTACGERIGFVSLHRAAVLGHAGQHEQADQALTNAVSALSHDTVDKRREALFDLQHEPLFASLRGSRAFTRAVDRLYRSLPHV
jgi:hypothetical protein